jgi:hypothetical protein
MMQSPASLRRGGIIIEGRLSSRETVVSIDSYSFGEIVIQGRTFHSDLIIYPDKVDDRWWRKEGHILRLEDLTNLLAAKPEVLIIGTGYMGQMKVPDDVRHALLSMKIELYVEDSRRAVDIFNSIHTQKRTIAAFHLTC